MFKLTPIATGMMCFVCAEEMEKLCDVAEPLTLTEKKLE